MHPRRLTKEKNGKGGDDMLLYKELRSVTQLNNAVESVLRGESCSSPVGALLFGGEATPKVASLLRARSSSNLRINAAGSVKRT